MQKKVVLLQIENNREISPETDGAFFLALRRGLLLALKEEGLLSEEQFCLAEEKIRAINGR